MNIGVAFAIKRRQFDVLPSITLTWGGVLMVSRDLAAEPNTLIPSRLSIDFAWGNVYFSVTFVHVGVPGPFRRFFRKLFRSKPPAILNPDEINHDKQ